MAEAAALAARGRSQLTSALLPAALLAGAMDITAACIQSGLRGVGPVRVLHSVTSGLLGARAFQGGVATAALGLALHFLIAFIWAMIYFLASRRVPLLLRQPFLCGVLYGIVVYLMMYRAVVPLSAAPFKFSFTVATVLTNLLIHIFCIGLPIALVISRRVR